MGLVSLMPILGKVAEKVVGVIDQVVEDKDLRNKLKAEIQRELIEVEKEVLELERQLIEAQRDVIVAEAKSESWITRTWRPISMLVLLVVSVGGFLLAGLGVLKMTPALHEVFMKLLDIFYVGLIGYVGGRSLEKITKNLAVKFKGGEK